VEALKPLMASESGVEQVPTLLAAHGIRFVVLPSLTKAPVDGAAALNEGAPFVVMSLRHGQLDRFWFVLMHELAHIHAGDKAGDLVLDNYDERVAPSDKEAKADKLAAEWILPAETFIVFVRRGDMSLDSIKTFAAQQGIHPALLIGRLKSEGWLPWSAFGREHPSVRDHLARGMKFSN
jgi:HTH-type transcriptional regulator/antitoxin HigA